MNITFGVFFSVFSSIIFGALYYFSPVFEPLSGIEIFGLRMLLTLPFLTLLMAIGGEWDRVRATASRVRLRPTLLLGLCCTSALLGVQQWLFLWAPLNDAALDVSLGYFLLPLTMLAVGRLFYGEALSPYQRVATLVASLGVIHEITRVGIPSWETLLVALGFPAYFTLRRKLGTNDLGGLWFDILLMSPIAMLFLATHPQALSLPAAEPRYIGYLMVLAALSASAFMFLILASRLLPMSLFGLLGYLEPLLLFLASLALGEALGKGDLLTYLPILTAVALMTADGLRNLSCRKHPLASPRHQGS